jgi:phosphoadenosine phosphosulfate reductase
MDFNAIRDQLNKYRQSGLKLFTTSSFQTHSLVLLHLISRIDKSIPVFFINTGYHFPETVAFKDKIAGLFELDVRNVFPLTPKKYAKGFGWEIAFCFRP